MGRQRTQLSAAENGEAKLFDGCGLTAHAVCPESFFAAPCLQIHGSFTLAARFGQVVEDAAQLVAVEQQSARILCRQVQQLFGCCILRGVTPLHRWVGIGELAPFALNLGLPLGVFIFDRLLMLGFIGLDATFVDVRHRLVLGYRLGIGAFSILHQHFEGCQPDVDGVCLPGAGRRDDESPQVGMLVPPVQRLGPDSKAGADDDAESSHERHGDVLRVHVQPLCLIHDIRGKYWRQHVSGQVWDLNLILA
ncbi:hypothetical protein DEMA109039_17560 [Deinococcus marmoris]